MVAFKPRWITRDFESGQEWRQYIFAAIASITVLLAGFVMGWTSPVNIKLQDVDQSPLSQVITKKEESLIGSFLTIGAMLGPFISSPIAAGLGRKWGLLFISIPLFAGLAFIGLANNVILMYVGRILWGIAVGSTFTVLPMYCVEIATVNARGTLGTFLELFVAFGFTLVYATGPYLSYHAIIYVGIGITLACISFCIIPESPRYLLMKNDKEAAAASLVYLRGKSRKYIEEELAELVEEVNTSMEKTAKIKDVFKGTNLKSLCLSCILLLGQQFCGITPMLFFATNIFDASKTKMDKHVSTIIVGVVQIFSSFTSSILVEKVGRKILLLISSAGLAVGLFFLGLFFMLEQQKNPIVESLSLLPLLSLATFVISYYIGLGPIAWAVVYEIQSIEVKKIVAPLCAAFSWSIGFIVTRYFGPLAVSLGWHIVFWMFAANCVFVFFFTLFVVPETKGKTALEIQEMLAGRKKNEDGQEQAA